ncbi:ABC-type multidrug transport system fused ATPase/permease subunit [Sphingomonas zeicaulis]|uniref:ABC transporter ATP-binding protein n=1 Tax=Sphingomonas zeicaulis TaxID=1632740 RepID=UPI003D1ACD6A
MNNIWRIVTLIPEYRWRIAIIIAASAIIGLAGTATPYIFRHIVDAIAALLARRIDLSAAEAAVALALLGFVALRLAIVLFSYLLERQSDSLWLNTVSTLRRRVFDNMTHLSIDYYERTRTGEILDRFGAVTSITMWLFQLSEGTLATILQLVFGTAVLLVKAPAVGLIMLLVIPFNLAMSFREVRKTRPLKRKWNGLVGKMSGLLSEMVSQIATVRSFAGEAAIKRRYEDVQVEWWATRTVEQAIQQHSGVLLNIVNTVAIVLSVVIVTRGALGGAYSVGDILLVLTLTQTMINGIPPVTRLVNTTGEVDASAERLVELLDVAPTVVDAPDAIDLGPVHTIEFRHVGFHYPGKATPALHDVSFRVEPGQMLALVGQSGSGKSTIIKLLMRFYDPQEGAVLINGTDLRRFRQASLRAQIGAVLQDVALFNDTIAENIRFARPEATLEEVYAASRAANADNFVRSLPDGYETLSGERGVRLSGGEKQRIAIARALLRDPNLIILDEATSALDSESERLVQEGLATLLSGRTSVVIAHRLTTIRNADRILVMQSGRIVETGDHRSLIGRPDGVYAQLHALQSLAPAD